MLEKVQQKAVSLVHGLRGATYKEKCRELDLDLLSVRTERADLIQVYKIMNGLDKVDEEKIFKRMPSTENGHRVTRHTSDQMNLQQERSRLDIRKNGFAVRVVQPWNNLSREIKRVPKLSQFKTMIKKMCPGDRW